MSETGTFGVEPYYPIVGFYFTVSFSGISNEVDSKFKEVSGLEIKLETIPVKAGGDDGTSFELPEKTTFSNLVLSRGLLSADSALTKWCYAWLLNDYNQPRNRMDIFLKLLNEQGNPVFTWQFIQAYPIGIKIGGFNAMAEGSAAIMIETLTFKYSNIKIVNL